MDGSGLRVTSPSRSVISGARPSLRPKRVLFLPIPFPLFVLNQGDRWSESCECRPDLFLVAGKSFSAHDSTRQTACGDGQKARYPRYSISYCTALSHVWWEKRSPVTTVGGAGEVARARLYRTSVLGTFGSFWSERYVRGCVSIDSTLGATRGCLWARWSPAR